MNEPRVVESVTNECQSLGRAHESSSARAEQLIACLESEIAKRDEELAACRVAVENCEVFRARIAELEAGDNTELLKAYMNAEAEKGIELVKLRAELSAIKAQEPVEYQLRALIRDVTNIPEAGYYMPQSWHDQVIALSLSGKLDAPSPAGVVMPDRDAVIRKAVGMCNRIPGSTTWNAAEFAYDELADCLNAAPAAPAADAGLVDMYRHLQTVTPYRFKKIQDASITDGGDVMYFHKDRFDAALLADMATHCAAKGVA